MAFLLQARWRRLSAVVAGAVVLPFRVITKSDPARPSRPNSQGPITVDVVNMDTPPAAQPGSCSPRSLPLSYFGLPRRVRNSSENCVRSFRFRLSSWLAPYMGLAYINPRGYDTQAESMGQSGQCNENTAVMDTSTG
jgi:hypothetical protein